MIRVLTVSEIKSGHDTATRDLPRVGSLARRIYDVLHEHRGRPVDLHVIEDSTGDKCGAINRLRDDYGCDIRHGRGRCVYILCGEWFGAHYSDYVIEAIDAACKADRAAA